MPLPLLLALHLGCFFVVGMVCHGELARRRPPTARLTEFYFFLSVGGVLGGAFNALLAPLIFPGVWEYPLALIAACLVKPATPEDAQARPDVGHRPAARSVGPVVLLPERVLPPTTGGGKLPLLVAAFGYMVPAIALLNFSPRRWRFALGVAVLLFAPADSRRAIRSPQTAASSAFTGIRIVEDGHSHALTLMNGTTMHGVKSLVPGEEKLPMAYYSQRRPVRSLLRVHSLQDSVRHVAVVGLGTGGLACYAQPGQDWTFYEIDPLVERMARDPVTSNSSRTAAIDPRVVLGDARLTIDEAPDAQLRRR